MVYHLPQGLVDKEQWLIDNVNNNPYHMTDKVNKLLIDVVSTALEAKLFIS